MCSAGGGTSWRGLRATGLANHSPTLSSLELYPISPPHSLFPTLVHSYSYSSLEGVNENE